MPQAWRVINIISPHFMARHGPHFNHEQQGPPGLSHGMLSLQLHMTKAFTQWGCGNGRQ